MLLTRAGECHVVQLPLDVQHLLLDGIDLLQECFGVGDRRIATRRCSELARVAQLLAQRRPYRLGSRRGCTERRDEA